MLTAQQLATEGIEQLEKDPTLAKRTFTKALELCPNDPAVQNLLGIALHKTKESKKAVKLMEQSIKATPDIPFFHNNIANVLKDLGEIKKAEDHFKQAISLKNDYIEAYSGLSLILLKSNQHAKALEYCQKILELNPNNATIYRRLAIVFHLTGQYDQAIKACKHSLEIDPNHERSRFLMSGLLLTTGDFVNGWKEYGWRLHSSISNHNTLGKPLFEAKPTEKKQTVLVYQEQGFGDTIQFIRYFALMKNLGYTIVYSVPKELEPLLRNCGLIDQVVIGKLKVKDIDKIDCQVPLMNLPEIFGTTIKTIPADVPYIFADKEKTVKWTGQFKTDKFKIGLVWAGATKHKNDYNRSSNLKHFEPLSKLKNVQLYSLQKGKAEKQLKNATHMNIINIAKKIKDFSDTAAIIENLDLVITVDTSVSHLAGAMGKRVWTILPFVPEWRWMLDRADSPWYPTMTLFRQKSAGDWKTLLFSIAKKVGKITQ